MPDPPSTPVDGRTLRPTRPTPTAPRVGRWALGSSGPIESVREAAKRQQIDARVRPRPARAIRAAVELHDRRARIGVRVVEAEAAALGARADHLVVRVPAHLAEGAGAVAVTPGAASGRLDAPCARVGWRALAAALVAG